MSVRYMGWILAVALLAGAGCAGPLGGGFPGGREADRVEENLRRDAAWREHERMARKDSELQERYERMLERDEKLQVREETLQNRLEKQADRLDALIERWENKTK